MGIPPNNNNNNNTYYCIFRGRIKGFNSAIYAIKCQQVVIELWLDEKCQ